MEDEKSDSDAKDGGTSCFLNNFQTTADSIEVLITNLGEKFSSEIAEIWSEIDSMESNVLVCITNIKRKPSVPITSRAKRPSTQVFNLRVNHRQP